MLRRARTAAKEFDIDQFFRFDGADRRYMMNIMIVAY
jgi:hypothetical protein